MTHHYPAIITLLSLLLFLFTTFVVGHARVKYAVPAPATTGHPVFERYFRVQMNTLENLVLFLPALWLFAIYVSYFWSGVIGLLWLIGRSYYAACYMRAAETRSAGYAIGLLAFTILFAGCALGIAKQILAGV